MQRSASLARFTRAFHAAAVASDAVPERSIATVQRMCAALDNYTGQPGDVAPQMLPACRHLDAALTTARAGPTALARLAYALQELAPLLHWRRKTGPGCFDAPFMDGHANTQIMGPEGLEQRNDVVMGASLLAPHVTYPDHDHPPEEIYLVMSEGDWFTRASGWYTPGSGGIVHHAPAMVHAMRSGARPLLAVWCLWVGR